jgi:hypothetical protein
MKMEMGIFSALSMLSLAMSIFVLAEISLNEPKVVVWSVPKSKGCTFPVKEVRHIKTEMEHIVPYSQIHKCYYDRLKRLVKVSTYNFERGYQMKKPTEEVLYKWNRLKLLQYSVRKATHGNGDVDVEVYVLKSH